MKHWLLSLALFVSLHTMHAAEGGLNWHTSLPAAQAKAKDTKKLVLLDFTGSDWCGWCIKLNKEVFQTPEFIEYAKNNLELVEVDFPQRKKQTAEQKKANQALQDKYGVQGYPTLVILNSAGKKVGELGYEAGGPKPFIARLEKIRAKN